MRGCGHGSFRELMDCIVCGCDAGYHRAIVDSIDGRQVGGLCRECERLEFGRSLARGLFRETDGCILCPRDGHVALPLGEPVARRTPEEGVISDVSYAVGAETPRLCDEHLHELRGDAASPDRRTVGDFW